MKRLLILSLFLTLIPSVVFSYTSPGNANGYVNDFAGVLSQEGEARIELMLAQYEQQTGNELAVVIIPELIDETIETYSTALFQDWGIGKKGQDNGILFLVSTVDKQMKIEVGYGLEGDFTDAESKYILANVVPNYFIENNFDEGVAVAVASIMEGIGAEVAPSAGVIEKKSSGIGDYFWFLIFGFMWMGSIFARSRSWWAGGMVGAVIGIIILVTGGAWWYIPGLILFGLGFDYLVSTKYKKFFSKGHHHSLAWPLLFLMGGRPGRSWDKGGFGGFGGGMSGGGGATGDW
jgi:uncharacterized protein